MLLIWTNKRLSRGGVLLKINKKIWRRKQKQTEITSTIIYLLHYAICNSLCITVLQYKSIVHVLDLSEPLEINRILSKINKVWSIKTLYPSYKNNDKCLCWPHKSKPRILNFNLLSWLYIKIIKLDKFRLKLKSKTLNF